MAPLIRVGTAGWSYRDWEGIVYPESGAGRSDHLAWMAEWFDLVEINVSFYRVPSPSTAAGWVRRVSHNPAFCFTAKLPQEVTHGDAPLDGSVMSDWLRFAAPLADGNRLAAALAQFPWSLRDTDLARERIDAIARAVRPIPLAVEVRHGSFGGESWTGWLRAHELSLAAIDQPLIGESIGPSSEVTASPAYVRLHGRNARKWFNHDEAWERYDYLYSLEELSSWAARIESMARKGDVLVVMNNHWRGQAAVNAVEMKQTLGLDTRVPPPLARAWPERFPGRTLLG